MKRGIASLFLCVIAGASAWSRADVTKLALRADDPVSELGVARIADENGDAALLAGLRGELGRSAQLLAARAAPYAHAPEALWRPLVELACGRDPALAPEAAAALTASEGRLAPSELAARELVLADLRALRADLSCKGAPPRPDIAAALGRFQARFDALSAELEPKTPAAH